jgi:hypothetical protein
LFLGGFHSRFPLVFSSSNSISTEKQAANRANSIFKPLVIHVCLLLRGLLSGRSTKRRSTNNWKGI